jgi:hypothetical protein
LACGFCAFAVAFAFAKVLLKAAKKNVTLGAFFGF